MMLSRPLSRISEECSDEPQCAEGEVATDFSEGGICCSEGGSCCSENGSCVEGATCAEGVRCAESWAEGTGCAVSSNARRGSSDV